MLSTADWGSTASFRAVHSDSDVFLVVVLDLSEHYPSVDFAYPLYYYPLISRIRCTRLSCTRLSCTIDVQII